MCIRDSWYVMSNDYLQYFLGSGSADSVKFSVLGEVVENNNNKFVSMFPSTTWERSTDVQEYFENVLNGERTETTDTIYQAAEPLIEDPSYEEIKNVIKSLKNHKAPGSDGITLELLKSREVYWRRIYDLIISCLLYTSRCV